MSTSTKTPTRPLQVCHVAQKLGVATHTVRWWIKRGWLRATRRGARMWIIARTDFISFAASRGVVVV